MILDSGFVWYEELLWYLEVLFNYSLRPKAEADNTLQDLPNSFYHTKAESNNCLKVEVQVPILYKNSNWMAALDLNYYHTF